MADEGVLTSLQVLDDVLIKRVHVLHQPLGRGVVHLGEDGHIQAERLEVCMFGGRPGPR